MAEHIYVKKRGYELIRDPLLNKGTAFSSEERHALCLRGLLPPEQNTMAQQAERVYRGVTASTEPLERYVALAALQDRNEHLFYRILTDNLEELMPIVYTPTVGLATQNFSQVFQRGRGLWITPDMRNDILQVLRAAVDERNIRLIVATDNESILGIGDQGAGGMAISVGKLALYVAGAGVHPSEVLPISLDVGTNNQTLLDDPRYLGWRHQRLTGTDYDGLVDEFVEAVKTVCPQALLQWEDFRKDNALTILNRHQDNVLSFNDDIQGTGAIALAGIYSALRISKEDLVNQRILIHGAGAAGLGIAKQIKVALVDAGLSHEQATVRVGAVDSGGLLVDDRSFRDAYKQDLAWPAARAVELGLTDPQTRWLAAVCAAYRPTVLIGASGQAGAFSEAIVRQLAADIERPIVLPFSNPTAISEATPADLLQWTDGRVLVATGSPFEPVSVAGKSYVIGQGNNVFIFPGLGLGALASGSTKVTNTMVTAASNALAEAVLDSELAAGMLFPAITRLRQASNVVARAVARRAVEDGVAQRSLEDALATVDSGGWSADYPTLLPA